MVRKGELKGELHPRNLHREGYDFDALIAAHAPLERFVAPNKYGVLSINFFDPDAVRVLNCALLICYYNIEWWEIPPSALTPPIPGRADYIHYVADLVGASPVRCLDIGVGASCIFPIIGRAAYGWEFVGSDISESSIAASGRIVEANALLRDAVELRLQRDAANIFEGVIAPDDRFDLTVCNPPFHDSAQSAARGAQRKLRGLGVKDKKKMKLNFAGQDNELWCEGGERSFLERMIVESQRFGGQCRWFTSLVSSQDNLDYLRGVIRRCGAVEQRTIEMAQGNKRSRILAWRF